MAYELLNAVINININIILFITNLNQAIIKCHLKTKTYIMRKTILMLILSFFSSLSIAEEINLSCVSDKDQTTYIIKIDPIDEIGYTNYRTKDSNLPTNQLTVAELRASYSHYTLKFGTLTIGDYSFTEHNHFEINRSNLKFSMSKSTGYSGSPSQVAQGQCKVFTISRPNNVI